MQKNRGRNVDESNVHDNKRSKNNLMKKRQRQKKKKKNNVKETKNNFGLVPCLPL